MTYSVSNNTDRLLLYFTSVEVYQAQWFFEVQDTEPNQLFFCQLCKICCAQALSQKETEKAALKEKIVFLRQDLDRADMEMERMQRETVSQQKQDKVKYGRAILSRWEV